MGVECFFLRFLVISLGRLLLRIMMIMCLIFWIAWIEGLIWGFFLQFMSLIQFRIMPILFSYLIFLLYLYLPTIYGHLSLLDNRHPHYFIPIFIFTNPIFYLISQVSNFSSMYPFILTICQIFLHCYIFMYLNLPLSLFEITLLHLRPFIF